MLSRWDKMIHVKHPALAEHGARVSTHMGLWLQVPPFPLTESLELRLCAACFACMLMTSWGGFECNFNSLVSFYLLVVTVNNRCGLLIIREVFATERGTGSFPYQEAKGWVLNGTKLDRMAQVSRCHGLPLKWDPLICIQPPITDSYFSLIDVQKLQDPFSKSTKHLSPRADRHPGWNPSVSAG